MKSGTIILMRRFLTACLAALALAFVPLSNAAEPSPLPAELEPLSAMLTAQGVDKSTAENFVRALIQVDDDGEATALRKFLKAENEALATCAGIMLAQIEPAKTRKSATHLLRRGKGQTKALIITLSLVANKQTVPFLLSFWDDPRNEEHGNTIELALRAITTQELNTLPKWKKWWAENKGTIKIRPARTTEEATTRLQFAGNSIFATLLDDLAEPNDDPARQKVEDAIGDIFGQIGSLNALGMEEESKEATKADQLFRLGKLNKAEQSYRAAIEQNPKDLKSIFLLGCLEFERGDLPNALTRFRIIAKSEDGIAARFLVKLCVSQIEDPEKTPEDAAIAILKTDPKSEFADIIFNDIVLSRILGQKMVGKGLETIDIEELAILGGEHHGDVEIQIGVALLSGKARKIHVAGAMERFPESPLILSSHFRCLPSSMKHGPRAELLAVCKNWLAVDPENLLPHIYRALLEDLVTGDHLPDGMPKLKEMSEAQWSRLETLCATLEPNHYNLERFQAQQRVSELLHFPFPYTSNNISVPGSMFMPLSIALKERLSSQLEKSADVTSTVNMINTITKPPEYCTMMDCTILSGIRGTALSPLIDHYRASGEEQRAENLQSEIERPRQYFRKSGLLHMQYATLETIPIPSLRNTVAKRCWRNPESLTPLLNIPDPNPAPNTP